MSEQLTLDGKPIEKTITMHCYLVGDHDYYAATSGDEAERLHLDLLGLDDDEREEAQLVIGELLDKPWVDEDTREPCGTLRQWLAEATEPGWLAGTE
jgi:hypothetical protein